MEFSIGSATSTANFCTTVRCVVGAFSLLSVVVTDVVGVVLVELVSRVFWEESGSPKDEGLTEGETDGFEEKAVLLSAGEFEVSVSTEVSMQVLHAEGEMDSGLVDVCGSQMLCD